MNRIFLASFSYLVCTFAHAQIPAVLEKALRAHQLPVQNISLLVQSLSGEPPIASHRADAAMNPASVMKLVTTFSALSLLGPDYRWHTSAHLIGSLQGDVLFGDLGLRGGGDPKLVVEDLTEWIATMRRAGLRDIRGDLVIDESYFENMAPSMEVFDNDQSQPYNVRPYPLMMNFKATKFTISGQPGEAASIGLDPPLADVNVVNQIKVLNGPCKYGVNGLNIHDNGPMSLVVSGSYSGKCGEQATYAAVLEHKAFVYSFFKAAWLASGGLISGTVRIGRVDKSRVFSDWRSPRTLGDIVKDVNKFSNNVMARHLLLQIAAEKQKQMARVEDGRQIIAQFLSARGVSMPELVLENGSGLSRVERISAKSLAALLIHAASTPVAQLYQESMPIVGIDGTMARRLMDHPIAGNAWVKTGSLNQVSSIAGYVTARSGKRYAIALIANGPGSNGMRAVQDQLLIWVYQNG
jgi:serine-type D-Ala-D-Ala carboxypeptidase/endopeptidase (penicillin-binding protein 4)